MEPRQVSITTTKCIFKAHQTFLECFERGINNLKTVKLDGHSLTISEVIEVSRNLMRVNLSPDAIQAIKASRKFIEDKVAANHMIYGVNTGTGPNVHHTVPVEEVNQLQTNIVRMLCCGMGDALPTDVVRAMMLIRANSLARGHSGIRLEVLELLIELLNRG